MTAYDRQDPGGADYGGDSYQPELRRFRDWGYGPACPCGCGATGRLTGTRALAVLFEHYGDDEDD